MVRSPDAGQELSEDLLWSDEPGPVGSDDEQPAGSSEEPEAGGQEGSRRQQQHKGVDIAGASNASHQSSTLRASLDEDLDPGAPTPSPPVDVPGGGGLRRGVGSLMQQHQQQLYHHQLPRGGGGAAGHQQYSRLGTSAPIAIPNMSSWRGPGVRAGQPDAASTFIPPHQLSRQDDFTFSFNGASPSATIKRERLRARNAILRSTGFLEPQAGGAVAIPAAQQPAADKNLARTSVQSSLTAALTTIGESS